MPIDWDDRYKQLRGGRPIPRQGPMTIASVPYLGRQGQRAYQLWYVVRQARLEAARGPLRPLGFYRPQLEENNKRTFKILGVDVVQFTPSWHVVRELMLESLKRRGDFCWHCHTGIYAHTMRVALRWGGCRWSFWGDAVGRVYPALLQLRLAEEVDEKRFNRFINLGITAPGHAGAPAGAWSTSAICDRLPIRR